MQCLKCGRKYSDKRKICIYCGASLEGQNSSQKNYIVGKDSNIFITDEQNNEVRLEDLPEKARRKAENSIRKGDGEVIVKEEHKILQSSLEGMSGESGALSLEKILTLLPKMRDSLNKGHMEHSSYEKMVINIIKDYISSLADNIKLDFVVNGIIDSELSDYLNEEMLNDLRAHVISSISDKNKV